MTTECWIALIPQIDWNEINKLCAKQKDRSETQLAIIRTVRVHKNPIIFHIEVCKHHHQYTGDGKKPQFFMLIYVYIIRTMNYISFVQWLWAQNNSFVQVFEYFKSPVVHLQSYFRTFNYVPGGTLMDFNFWQPSNIEKIIFRTVGFNYYCYYLFRQ